MCIKPSALAYSKNSRNGNLGHLISYSSKMSSLVLIKDNLQVHFKLSFLEFFPYN